MKTIILENATKSIRGKYIFKNVSVDFSSGHIYGLIGRNGAGKTMLLKCICGLTNYSSGTITVNGKVVGKDIEIPDSIGVIIETPGFIPYKTAYSNLKYLADLSGKVSNDRINEIIDWVGLDSSSKKSVGKYSLGMKQRLGIAQAIMENPDILLLDEPMNGLDNNGVSDVKKMLIELKNQGKTIILSSHHMEDIKELSDEIYVMDNGCLSKYDE